MISTAGVVSSLAGGLAIGGVTYADDVGTSAMIYRPQGIALTATGLLLVTDGTHRVRVVSTAGVVSTVCGSGLSGSMDGAGSATSLRSPTGIAITGDGSIFVTEYFGHNLRKIMGESF